MTRSILVYDIEIVNAIPSPNIPAHIKTCAGWTDYQNMGIACICAYDYAEERYRVFGARSLDTFAELLRSRDYLVTYNGKRFDNNLLLAHGVKCSDSAINYDLFHEIVTVTKSMKGYSLDAVSLANLGRGKEGLPKSETKPAELAPILWQQGDTEKVIDYCLNDVHLTKCLFDIITRSGDSPLLVDPVNKSQVLRLNPPFVARTEWTA